MPEEKRWFFVNIYRGKMNEVYEFVEFANRHGLKPGEIINLGGGVCGMERYLSLMYYSDKPHDALNVS